MKAKPSKLTSLAWGIYDHETGVLEDTAGTRIDARAKREDPKNRIVRCRITVTPIKTP